MRDSGQYAARPWLRWYAQGVPDEINVPDISVPVLLEDAAEDFPRRVALEFLGKTMTYKALVDAVDKFAAALDGLGVRQGDRVALVLPNCPQNVIAFFAVLKLGAVVVQHNPLYTAPELHHQLADSGAVVVIAYDGAYARVDEACEGTEVRHVVVTSLADYLPSGKRLALRLPIRAIREKRRELVTPIPDDADVLWFGDLLQRAGRRTPPAVPITPSRDLAVLQYTGGTTGRPKGAMLTHRNLVANAYQTAAWDPQIQRGEEVVLAALPMFHVYGLTMCLTVNMVIAGTLVLLPKFDLGLLFQAVDKWRPTIFPGVPPMYDQLVRSRRTAKHDLRSVRTCVSGAMRLPPSTVTSFERVTGGRLVEGYGLTESAPVALANPVDENARAGTIGLPVPSTLVRIADIDDPSADVPLGSTGELCVRGPQVCQGYWNQPEDTAAMLRDGWLHTGDIAFMDEDGYVTIVDRKRDVILASGFSIFPSEIEDVLVTHPAVKDCAVAGVAHYYRGETVKAFVVLHPGQNTTESELRDFCGERLTAYKVPSSFEFREDLPKNMIGKVLRRVLREEHEAARQAAGYPEAMQTGEVPVPPLAAPPAPVRAELTPERYDDDYARAYDDASRTGETASVHEGYAGPTTYADGGYDDEAGETQVPPAASRPPAAPLPQPQGPVTGTLSSSEIFGTAFTKPVSDPATAWTTATMPVVSWPSAPSAPSAPSTPSTPSTPSYDALSAPADLPTSAGASRDLVSELERLARLRDAGVLSDEELHAAKMRLLG